MTDTSKREELIEAAAKAIAQEGRPDWSWDTADQWEHDLAREGAEAALAVFEQAYSPTDDEWAEIERVQKAAWAETHGQDPQRKYSVAEVKQIVYSFDNVLSGLLSRRAAAAEQVHVCDLTDSWFDRTECECGKMHYRCYECGAVVDECREGGDK